MNKVEFLKQMDVAIELGLGIEVKVNIPGNVHEELITNHADDVKNKKEYYDNTYDDNMKHKHATVVITGARYLSFEECI